MLRECLFMLVGMRRASSPAPLATAARVPSMTGGSPTASRKAMSVLRTVPSVDPARDLAIGNDDAGGLYVPSPDAAKVTD